MEALSYLRTSRRRPRPALRDPAEASEARASGLHRLTGIPWARLFGYLRGNLLLFGFAVAALLVGTGAGLLLPLVIGGLVGEVVSAGDIDAFEQLIVAMVALALVLAITSFAQTWSLGVVGERIVARVRAQLFDRLVTLELDFYVRRRVGELISRLSSDVTQLRLMLRPRWCRPR